MMREIKFRVWNIAREAMDTPYFFEQNPNGRYSYYEDWRDLEDGRSQDCELMQFTGLTDKNGVEIYEGDIVAFGDDVFTVPSLGTIQYAISSFGIKWNDDHSLLGSFGQRHGLRSLDDSLVAETDLRVAGNVYENPELLKPTANDSKSDAAVGGD